MDTDLSPEHEAFRLSVRGLLAGHTDDSGLCPTDQAATDRLRTALAAQRWTALAVPEEFGGDGFGFTECALVAEEMGRVLCPTSYLSSGVLAVPTPLAASDEQARRTYLRELAAGRVEAAWLGMDTSTRAYDAALVGRKPVDGRTGSLVVSGDGIVGLGNANADLLLGFATTPSGPAPVLIDRRDPTTAAAVRAEPLKGLDPSRSGTRFDLSAAPARLVGTAAEAEGVRARVVACAVVALAAEQVGACDELLRRTVDYLSTRHQFGRPIGSYQALKHQCADLLLGLESTRSLVSHASWALDVDPGRALVPALMCKALSAETFVDTARSAILLHGGIGFTWELPLHWYYRRAKASLLLFGAPAQYRDQLVDATDWTIGA